MKIHPLFFLIAIYFFAINKGELFVGYLIAIVVHENAHKMMAKLKGYNLSKITIMPYGGRVSGYTYKNCTDGLLIALARPIMNIVVTFIILGVLYLLKSDYIYLLSIVNANIFLAFINLFPIYPLDGAQVVFLFSKNKLKTSKLLKRMSYIFGAIFIVVTIVSIFYNFCVTLGVFGIFVILSTYLDRDKFLYEYIFNKTNKDKNDGIKLVEIIVDENINIYKLLKFINEKELIRFRVINKNKTELGIIKEEDIEKTLMNYPNIFTAKEFLENLSKK